MGRIPQGRIRSSLIWAICLAVIAPWLLATDLSAQRFRRGPGGRLIPVKPNESTNDESVENVFLQADRETLKKFGSAQTLVNEHRYAEAVRNLGSILDGAEDFFFQPDKNVPRHRSLKAEARRLIGELPREGRESYELQYGARAQQMLNEALAAGNTAQLAEVSRRFSPTKAGRQAAFLLGIDHFNRGRPLASALLLQRLHDAGLVEDFEPTLSLTLATAWLQANMPKKAAAALEALRQQYPAMRIDVAGREVPIFAKNADPVAWLTDLVGQPATTARSEPDQWLMFRGDPARNTAVAGGTPLLNLRWRVSTSNDPATEASLEQQQKESAEQGRASLPSLHPLAVGDVLLMRTLANLLAVDLNTGKRLWEVPVDDPFDSNATSNATISLQQAIAQTSGSNERAWNDLTFGTMSSDGRYVFSIEDLISENNRITFRNFNGRLLPAGNGQTWTTNRLAAHDIRTGKLKWHVGGPSGQYNLRLADTFFLGPPLPLSENLFVLGEAKNEIRLMALDAATGNLLWAQPLAQAEQSVADEPTRRVNGASPSYADGILICPTGNGAIVAVELATRSLLWGYCYSQEHGSRHNNGFAFTTTSTENDSRWDDASVTIADGRVLVTPIESESLYCLNLLDGSLMWKAPRNDACYLACVDGNHVILVGKTNVIALNLADGKPAWGGRQLALPQNAIPSGRGFLSNGKYYLPLSSAQVAEIDLANGQIANLAKSRNGTVLGNLICHRGLILSQAAFGVDAYFQADVVRKSVEQRLAANANDADALSLQGEVLLDAGKHDAAIAAFRRAYSLAPDQRTRELLRDSLLECLRNDFSAYRGQLPEVARLVDGPVQQAALLRVIVDGERKTGNLWASFEAAEKLLDLEPGQLPYDEIDSDFRVRRDRWLQGRFLDLRQAASGDLAAKMDQAIERRLTQAQSTKGVDNLRRIVGCFGDLPIAKAARDELAQRLRREGKLLEAEFAADEPPQPATTEPDKPWPTGKVDVATSVTKNVRANPYGRSAVGFDSPKGPFFRDLSLQFDNGRRTLLATDGWGQERWQVSLGDSVLDQNDVNAGFPVADSEGHLLLLRHGAKLVAIDTTGANAKSAPRIVWNQDVADTRISPRSRIRIVGGAQGFRAIPWRVQTHFLANQNHQSTVTTRRYICVQRLHNLMAIDPATGQTLWNRANLPLNCEIFGDEQHLLVLPPDRDEAMLIRALDGELLGTRRVPRVERRSVAPNFRMQFFGQMDDTCLAMLGTKMLLWWPDGNRRTLALVDPIDQRDAWKDEHTFSGASQACLLDHRAVGVMEPNGHFVLISLPDGRTMADLQLDPEQNLQGITLFASGDQIFLVTNQMPMIGRAYNMHPIPGCATREVYRGRVYAMDQQGKLQWPRPIDLTEQALLLNQPSRLPILVFVNQVNQQKPNGEGRWTVPLLCIDKRTGRVVYGSTFGSQTSMFEIAGDPTTHTISMALQQKTIKLTFTDAPIPAEAPAGVQPANTPKKPKPTFWDSVKKAFGDVNEADKSTKEDDEQ